MKITLKISSNKKTQLFSFFKCTRGINLCNHVDAIRSGQQKVKRFGFILLLVANSCDARAN